jgi:Leucine-rich repeat (LRR) protein
MANILGKVYGLSTTALHLAYKRITSEMLSDLFENINKLTNLEYLYIDYNQITIIPRNIFDKLTNLIHLDISNNQLSTIGLPENIFDKLTNLRRLDLYDNHILINDLPRKIFKRLTKLQFLYIDNRYKNNISKRYIKLSKQEKLKEKIKLAKLRTAIFKEELYMKTLHYSKINLFDTSYF